MRLRLSFLCLLVWLLPTVASAQVRTPAKTYTYLIYHKLAPGMTIQNALPVEREWKAINQAAVDEGKLIGWHMMVKQFSSNPNPSEYDYVTCIVSPTMNMGGASPAAMARIYGDSVQTRMADLNRRDRLTAPVVKIEIWENLDALYGADFGPGKTGTVVVDFLKLRDPGVDPSGMLIAMKQAATTRIAQQQAGGWSFSALMVPAGTEKGYGYALTRPVTNLSVLTQSGDARSIAAQKQLTRTFEVVRQEVYRFEQYTTRPTAAR